MAVVDVSDLIVFPRRDKYWFRGATMLLLILIAIRVHWTMNTR
jgi:hypothetical protein